MYIEYDFGIRSKREGDSKSGSRKSRTLYHGWFQKDPKPYQYGKMSEEIRSNQSIYDSPE
jgi:hypothetical protein